MPALLTRLRQLVDPAGAHWADVVARERAEPVVLPDQVSPAPTRDADRRVRLCYQASPALRLLHERLPGVHVEVVTDGLGTRTLGDFHPGRTRIRVDASLALDQMLHTLLHEFGHAVAHHTLTDADRYRLQDRYGYPTWDGRRHRWSARAGEWHADAFADHHWPAELGPPPRRIGPPAQADDRHLFDIPDVAVPVLTGRRRTGPVGWWRRLGTLDRAAVAGAAALAAVEWGRRPR